MTYERLALEFYNAYVIFSEKGIHSDIFNEVDEICMFRGVEAGLEMLNALAQVKIPQEQTVLPVEVMNFKRSEYFAFVGAGPAENWMVEHGEKALELLAVSEMSKELKEILSNVWQNSMDERVWRGLQMIIR